MKIYMEITRDKYELPLAVADSPARLAEMCGVTVNCVASSCSHYRHGRYQRGRYVKVEVDDEGD